MCVPRERPQMYPNFNQRSSTVGCEQKPYAVRYQDLVEKPLISISQLDQVYVALQIGWFFLQMAEHPLELLVIIFDRIEQNIDQAELFPLLIGKGHALGSAQRGSRDRWIILHVECSFIRQVA